MYVEGYPLINNGFTLIELLAVIVILAIIALIAVPIILNIIDNSKESAVLVSGKNYIRAIEQQILSKNIKEKFSPEICIIQEDGNLMCDGDKLFTVEVSGSKPTSGEIKFNNKKITEVIEMILDGYVLEMELDKELIVKGTTDILEPPLNPQGTYLMVNPSAGVNSSDTYFLGQEQIKRNQVENIIVTYTNKVPSNAIYSWDTSETKDKSIMAWYTNKDNNNLYELYIGGEGGVKANPDSSNLFSFFNNATSIDVNYLDTSEVTNMYRMFAECGSLTNLDLNNFNTSNVTNMQAMFSKCSNLLSINLSNFNTSSVTSMSLMFSECSKLENIIFGNNFNTGKVTSMYRMFAECGSLTNIKGIDKFNNSNLKSTQLMFYRCSSLKELDLSNFNTSKVTDMQSMFSGCSDLINLDLSSFNTLNVTTMYGMFNNCNKLTTIDIRNAVFTNVTDYRNVFSNCSKLTTVIVKDNDAKIFIDNIKSGVAVIA